jgi:hypothetical protein
MSAFALTLPLPSSMNTLFKNTPVSRAPTSAYRDWKKQARGIAEAVRPRPLTGRYALAVAVPARGPSKESRHNERET